MTTKEMLQINAFEPQETISCQVSMNAIFAYVYMRQIYDHIHLSKKTKWQGKSVTSIDNTLICIILLACWGSCIIRKMCCSTFYIYCYFGNCWINPRYSFMCMNLSLQCGKLIESRKIILEVIEEVIPNGLWGKWTVYSTSI